MKFRPLIALLTFLLFTLNISFTQEISVMSYNIRLDLQSDGPNWWEIRKARVASLMNYYEADFIGCQEVLHRQLTYLDSNLKGYAHIGVGRDDGKEAGEYSPIFYKKTLYELVKSSTFWLSPTPEKPSKGWDAALNRVCTYGLFRHKKTKKEIWVFNTHFDHVGKEARLASAQLILDKIKELNVTHAPVILCGDLNARPEEAPAQLLSTTLWNTRDKSQLNYGDADTWNAFQFNKKPVGCIDYIFTTPFPYLTVKKFATLTDSYDQKYPSDHFPVLATLVLKPTTSGKVTGSTIGTIKSNSLFSSKEEEKVFNEVQKATFQYFWEGAEPNSGLARERFHADNIYPENDKHIITSGGGGFGVMAILVAMENNYITRKEGVERLKKIVQFLETADRFHGAWPHWWNGETGKVKPFGKKDDGGDLVETSFMIQGLLCARQYLQQGTSEEKALAKQMDALWKSVDFNWYRNGQNVLYWHWSPNYQWEMNFPVRGYNECLIMYVLAASSPTHGVPAAVYHEGWAENGKIKDKPAAYDGIALGLRHQGNAVLSGPLFWAHYSYLGLDPRGLKDNYADYWKETSLHAKINYQWCVNNPLGYKGYGPDNWGLTASYSTKFYAAHAPGKEHDLGVISPTAALSSFPYTPKESMAAMMNWYKNKKDKIWGPFGFYDAFSETANWYSPRYLAIDQGPIVVMMENYRSGLLWNLFMSCPEIQAGLKKLGFESPYLK